MKFYCMETLNNEKSANFKSVLYNLDSRYKKIKAEWHGGRGGERARNNINSSIKIHLAKSGNLKLTSPFANIWLSTSPPQTNIRPDIIAIPGSIRPISIDATLLNYTVTPIKLWNIKIVKTSNKQKTKQLWSELRPFFIFTDAYLQVCLHAKMEMLDLYRDPWTLHLIKNVESNAIFLTQKAFFFCEEIEFLPQA